MELKTLKDLQEFGSNGIKKLHYVECDKLKAEAVKELKLIDHPIRDREIVKVLELDKKCKNKEEISNALFGVRRYLIWKNNLTSEDLK